MPKRMVMRGLAAAVLLCAAAVPVMAALEGHINYAPQQMAQADITGSIDTSVPDCGPAYMPTLVHERDGSIIGMVYVLDGDNC
ncbi:hypothetical protein [Rhizobium tubonense]|nr:hypothetical protein [Rhizobium tubonense]